MSFLVIDLIAVVFSLLIGMKYLGIDYGEKFVGLAVTDDEGLTAFPFKTIEVESKRQLLDDLERIVEFEGIRKVVVGIPYTLKGEEGKAVEMVETFIKDLRELLNVEVERVDERLTSAEAHNLGGEKKNEHAIAAQLILDTYLTKERNREGGA